MERDWGIPNASLSNTPFLVPSLSTICAELQKSSTRACRIVEALKDEFKEHDTADKTNSAMKRLRMLRRPSMNVGGYIRDSAKSGISFVMLQSCPSLKPCSKVSLRRVREACTMAINMRLDLTPISFVAAEKLVLGHQ